ncbi:ABC transporter substrate-binding protein [Chloroflexota bacterium]
MQRTLSIVGIFILFLTLALSGCAAEQQDVTKGPITVGSKLDLEGQLLGQIIILMLEDNGFQVNDRTSFGATSIVRKALESGEIDSYPEYTGNIGWFFDEAESAVWKDLESGWQRANQLDKENYNIEWLRPVPITNDWAIAIPRALAEKEGLKTLEDFAAYVNADNYIKLIGSEEFVSSPAALPAFQEAYGFTLAKEQLLTVSGGDTTLTEKAASEGIDGVNAAMAYSTDGGISAYDLVVLTDNLSVNPIYAPAPRIRGEILGQYPEIAEILNPVFTSLDLVTLQNLNQKTAVEGLMPANVARDYLVEKGFIK